MSAASSAKAANRGPMDAFLFKQGASLFFPKPWNVVSNFTYETVELSPEGPVSYGGTARFRNINNVSSYTGRAVLQATFGAATSAQPAARYDDFLMHSLVENYSTIYGQSTLETLTGETEKWKFYDQMVDEESHREVLRDEVFGPYTPAERQNLFVTGGTGRVCLNLFHGRGADTVMPMVTGADVYYEFRIRNFSDLVQGATSATAPTTFSLKLFLERVYVGPDEQALLQSKARTTDGILRLYDRVQRENVSPIAITSGNAVTMTIPLDQVNTSTTSIRVLLRNQANLNTAYAMDRWSLLGAEGDQFEITNMYIQATGGTFKARIPLRIKKPHEWLTTRSGPGVLDRVWQIDFSKHPIVPNHAFGSLNLGLLNKVELVIVGTANASITVVPMIESDTKNIMKYTSGNLYPVFNA